jgi:preprotein translocase subunit SecY
LIGKTKQDICWVIGPLIVFWGIAFLAYYYTSDNPTLTSGIGLFAAIVLTVGGIIVMYIGDKWGRPSRITKG